MLYCTFTTEQLQRMSLFENAIAWLSPPDCIGCGHEGSILCENCLNRLPPFGERCWSCSALSQNSKTCKACRRPGSPDRVWVATDYRDQAAELVKRFKFSHNRSAALPISLAMAKSLGSQDADLIIVPVPTATGRIRQRGFDHASLLAKKLSRLTGYEINMGLKRIGQSRQVGAKRDARLKQLDEKFFVSKPDKIAGKHFLIIDDVLTTGSTLLACSKILRKNGARHVDALVFTKKL